MARGTRAGARRKTARRAYARKRPSPKIAKLEKSNKALRSRLRKSRGGNPFPHGPHLKTELEAAASVLAGGALNGYLASMILKAQTAGTLPALPAGIQPQWAVTALLFAAPAMGWVKGANGARLALASSGMAAAQLSNAVAIRTLS